MGKHLLGMLLFIGVLFNGNALLAQDTVKNSVDSAELKTVELYNDKLVEIDAQGLIDSLKKKELQAQLESVNPADNVKKEELQKQLNDIQQKETDRIAYKKAQIDSLKQYAKGFPVTGFFNDTLFLIYNRLGSFSAKDRATAITNRLKKVEDDFNLKSDSFTLSPTETVIDILYGESIIMSVSENDALWNDTTTDGLAQEYKTIIESAIIMYKDETSLITIAKEIALALLVLLVVGVLIFYVNKLFKWTALKINEQEGNKINGLTIRNYTLFDAKRQVKVMLNINTVLKWFVVLVAIYIALPVLFRIFPWTKSFSDVLFGYVITPVKSMLASFWHFLPNLITIIVIITVFRYVLKFVRFLKDEVEKGALTIPGFYTDWANPTFQIVRVLIVAFMVILIFPYLPGSDSPIFRGVSVFLGFLFTFGSAGSLSNIIAGLVLTYMRLFKIGDRVKIGDVFGDVIEKSMLVTRVRTTKNEIISIPNSSVMSSHTINYSSDAPEKGLIVHTTVTIGYDVPWKNVHEALLTAASRTEHLLNEPLPFVLQTSLEDFYVAYQVNAYTRMPNKQALIYSELHRHIQDVFNENGIEILSPHYRAQRDGNTVTIPSDYLPEDYKAPGFNVNVTKDGEKD